MATLTAQTFQTIVVALLHAKRDNLHEKIFLILLVAVSVSALHAETAAAKPGMKFGFLFDVSSLLSDITAFGDGFQSGAGFKLYLIDNLAIRCLANLYLAANASSNRMQTSFGLGVGGEYHFLTGPASPYAGLTAGISTYSSQAGVKSNCWKRSAFLANTT